MSADQNAHNSTTLTDDVIDTIAIKHAHGHPDFPVTETEIGILLTEIERLRGEVANLRKWRSRGGMLRDVVESIGVGGAQMTKREEVLRGQCRLLVKAFDEGVL